MVKEIENGIPQIALTDFGFMNRRGGTPLLASPECQLGTLSGMSDIYSLGGCFLHVISNMQVFVMLTMSPLMDDEETMLAGELQKNPIVKLAKRMMNPDPFQRPKIDDILNTLEQIDETCFGNNLANDPNVQQLMKLWNVDVEKDFVKGQTVPLSARTRCLLRKKLPKSG